MALTKLSGGGLVVASKPSRLVPPIADGWTRPTDWLALPSVVSGVQKFVGLLAVYPGDSNWVNLNVAGAYTVDWGDGTAPANVNSGVSAVHNYTYASVSGTDSTRGYRQAVVTVTMQGAANLTTLNLAPTRPTGMIGGWSSPWLDVKMAGANLTSLTVSIGNGTRAGMLERFEYVGNSALTTLSYPFESARVLQRIVGTAWTSGVTDFSGMFNACSTLRTIPLLNTAAGVTFSDMFNGCSSLQTIPLLNTAAGTNFTNMLRACTTLQTAVPLLNTAAGTNFTNMFAFCTSLQTIPLFNTAAGTDFSGMFNGCTALQTVPALNTAAGTVFTSTFNSCSSLQSAPLAGTSKTISYASCKLKGTALDAIYTALASGVTAQTITVTLNWDVANDTPSIATGKGWTVTG